MSEKLKGIWCWIVTMVLALGMAPSVRAQQVKPAAPAPAAAKATAVAAPTAAKTTPTAAKTATVAAPAAAKTAVAAPVAESAAPMESEWSNPLPSGRLNMGIHFGDQQTESFGDVLVPVVQFKSGLLFVNPRGSWNDSDGQEFNFGMGYRHLLPKQKVIVGGNLFYDLRNTSLDNTFNQFGAGLEFMSTWFDARANMYLPESGKKAADEYTVADGTAQEHASYWAEPTGQGNLITQYGYDVSSTYDTKTLLHYQMFEQAMEGYDFELGALLPIPVVKNFADIKFFGGYYDYNAHYGDDIAGVKGRVEIRPLSALYLDAAWYEDKELMGSHYSVGARVSVPFDLANLSRGKNPFAGALDGFKPGAAKPDFASRMTEMVMRDLHVRTDVSEPEEVVQDRRLLEKKLTGLSRQDFNLVLATDVTFVDDDNRSGVEDGTWENPYRKINTGIQNAVGTMVYVRDAAQQYFENAILREGLTLWGSGAPIYGQGNRYLGGIYPVVNGSGNGPAITLASHTTVAGFEVTQGLPPTPSQQKTPSLQEYAGIYGHDVTDVYIHDNYIHGAAGGIVLDVSSIPSFTANIANNRITDIVGSDKGFPRGNGIGILLYDVPEVDFNVANNEVSGCDGNGLYIHADGNDGDMFVARVSGNYSGNDDNGVLMLAEHYNLAAGLFVDTVANNNGYCGISVNFDENDNAGVLLASHADLDRVDQLVNQVLGALNFLPPDFPSSFSVVDYLGMRPLYRNGGSLQANGNRESGINISQSSSDINVALLLGTQTDNNGGLYVKKDAGGEGVQIYQGGGVDSAEYSIAGLVRCQANGNSASGVNVDTEADHLALNLFMDVTANNNGDHGIYSRADSVDGWAGSVVLSSDPLLGLIEAVSASPLLSSFMNPLDFSFIPAYGPVQANGNGADGIMMDVSGQDGTFGVVAGAVAGFNGGNGVLINQHSDDINIAALLGVQANYNGSSTAKGGGEDGIAIYQSGNLGIAESSIAALIRCQANGNAGSGVMINSQGDNLALNFLIDVTANHNGMYGVRSQTDSEHGWAGTAILSSDHLIEMAGSLLSGFVGPVDLSFIPAYGVVQANANGLDGISIDTTAEDVTFGLVLNAQANDNGGSGVLISQQSDGVNVAALMGVQADDNGLVRGKISGDDGIAISQVGRLGYADTSIAALIRCQANGNSGSGMRVNSMADGLAVNAFMDVVANHNGDYGILSQTESTDGTAGTVVLATDPLLSILDSSALNSLIDLSSVSSIARAVLGVSSIPSVGQVQANDNGYDGISIVAVGDEAAFGVVLDAQANGNGFHAETKYEEFARDGISIDVMSTNGVAIGAVGSTAALVSLVESVTAATDNPLDLSDIQTLGPLQANDNAGNGVFINARSVNDDAMVGVFGVEALRNGSAFDKVIDGDGIHVSAETSLTGGDAMVGLAMINASSNRINGINASAIANSADGEAMMGGIYIDANDNGLNGLSLNVQSQAPSSSYLVLGGVDANRNVNGSGIDALVTGAGEVKVAMTDIQADGNGVYGIKVETDSINGDSSVWLSGSAIQDMVDDLGGWDLDGIDLISVLPAGAIEANNNGDNGIYVHSSASNGDVGLMVNNVTASGNERHGVFAELNSSSSGSVYAAFTDIVANDNSNGLRVEATSGQSNVVLWVNHVTASSNVNNGINAILTAQQDVDVTVTNNTTEHNGMNGIRIEATSSNGSVTSVVADNHANGNSDNGIRTVLTASSQIDARYVGNETVGNDVDGLFINAAAGGKLMLFGERNVATDNGDDGIDVKTAAATGSANRQYDFGGGVLGSTGHNVMANNGNFDMERSGAAVFNARSNYWDGVAVPATNVQYVGNVNANNALIALP